MSRFCSFRTCHSWLIVLAIGAVGQILTIRATAQTTTPRIRLIGIRAAAPNRYQQDRMGMVEVLLFNGTPNDADIKVSTFFEGHQNEQFARRFWVPGNSQITTWCPISVPHLGKIGRKNFAPPVLKAWVYNKADQGDELLVSQSGKPYESLLQFDSHPITAVLGNFDIPPKADVFDVVNAARLSVGYSAVAPELRGQFLPPNQTAFHAVSHLVLCGDRLPHDAASLAATRGWLHRGGRLWIMLDQVDQSTVELLLGDSINLNVVDEVTLTSALIEGDRNSHQTIDFEEPIKMVRVLVDNVEIAHTVDGWPASFWRPVGQGEVLFTTLGARAWIVQTQDSRPARATLGKLRADAKAVIPLEDLAERLFSKPPVQVKSPVLRNYLHQRIGYEVVPFNAVAVVLGGFCGLVFAAAVFLKRTQLHWIGVIGPVSAIVSVVVLVIMGNQRRWAVPSTMAVVQVIQVESDSEDIQVSGQVAIYQPTGAATAFSSTAGGLFYPDLTGLRGDKKTIVWTDFDKWEWENLEFSGGEVRCADIRFSMTARAPFRISATFGPEGLTGSADFGPLKPFRDAIVVASDNQFVAVKFDENGNFHAQTSDLLAPNEFIASAILSDEQRRRQNVYRELFRREKTDLPQNLHQPMLLAWTDAVDVPLSLPDLDRKSNSAIVVTPLLLQRPPPSQTVRIPAPFVTYRLIPNPGKPNTVGMTSAYSTRTRKWRPSMQATQAFLRFQIPRSILPLQVERATMTLNIHSPSRLVKIVAFANGEETTLRLFESPSGTKQIVIQDASVLQLDDHGGFPIGILVEQHPAELAAVSGQSVPTVSEFPDLEWHIESVSMELEGVAAEK